jgi:hypothetical protein
MTGIGDTHRLATLYNHFVTESQVYPSLAAGATVVSAAVNWTYGAYATIVGAGSIAARFHVHAVVIETCNQNDVFQLQIYKGAADDVIATVRFSIAGGFFGNSVYPIASELIEAGNQVRARLAAGNGGMAQATMTISLVYVTG